LKQEISALQTEQKPLIARAEELQKTIIPALQAEITRLVEVKKDQEEQKNKLIVSKNETEAKNSDVATQIESQEKEIARVQVAIAESQTLYQENSEREQLERPQSDFFERM
jgi:chromosome segregation ATPase